MSPSNKKFFNSILGLLLFLLLCDFKIVGAADKCKGSIVFYWREKGEQRQLQKRYYGVLEREFKGNRSKLSTYFETKNAYAYTTKGDCCWEIYSENKYEGDSVKLKSGFRGIPGFPQYYANSVKKIEC